MALAAIPVDHFMSESRQDAHQHRRSVLVEQPVELSRHLLLAERFTERVVDTAKTPERLTVAKQVHDTRMLL
jgi:hypothetical protein